MNGDVAFVVVVVAFVWCALAIIMERPSRRCRSSFPGDSRITCHLPAGHGWCHRSVVPMASWSDGATTPAVSADVSAPPPAVAAEVETAGGFSPDADCPHRRRRMSFPGGAAHLVVCIDCDADV